MDKIQTTKERILIFLEANNIKKETFYRESGISASNFKGAGLKSDLGVDKLARILRVYPDLNDNLVWLITGEGELLTEADKNKKDHRNDDLYTNEINDKIGDLLANLFAQYNTQDKTLMFLQSQISKIEKKYSKAISEQNKMLNEILSAMKISAK
ncbi:MULTISPECIES: hypothetical protein [Chryseobacterium]|uniref:Transcriptional regulator n=1 Tax=Chryseobacterium nepalense TaxID=1854498 RepID=A0ABY4K5X1_9FLAO|nr:MULTISPECIES: hypothetical protein [Chryseobacterium]MEA1848761.1 hypothetical protein [Chryseobacterium sp. MHB01]MEC5174901.1 hypothetical protein [Chryseobacterium nepalense]UPQ76152.1 hypothetical protein M0D58_01080 [Chryseobacterium nepalense]